MKSQIVIERHVEPKAEAARNAYDQVAGINTQSTPETPFLPDNAQVVGGEDMRLSQVGEGNNAFKLNVPQTKVKPQMQIKKEVRNDEFNQFARRSGSDSINFKKVGETIGVPFEDDFGKGVYKYWKNGQPQAQIQKEVGGYKKGEEVGFAGILSPEGEARKGKFVRKVNEHLVEIDYGDHKELNHIKNIYKLDQVNSPLKSHTQLATEAKNRGYNDKNLLANIHNVKEELMEEHDSYRKYMVGIVNKYADKTSKTKSIRELMNPEEIKTMNELSAKSDRAYNLLKSEQSPQTKQFTLFVELDKYTAETGQYILPLDEERKVIEREYKLKKF